MNQCQNCGQINTTASNFCRFCGTKFSREQFSNSGNYEFEPPRPYVWKTDELRMAESKAKRVQPINQVQPLNRNFAGVQPPPPQPPVAYRQPQNMAFVQPCPRCGSQQMPRFERKISTAGWIVFAALIFSVAFFWLSWIGLLIKEDARFCPTCNLRLG